MDVIADLKKSANPKKVEHSKRFFKTGPGEYGEGDKFLGVTVPEIRKAASKHKDISLDELRTLVSNKLHEVRLMGLIILVNKYKKSKLHIEKQEIVDFYINNLEYVNNWDLVDSSAHHILGAFVYEHPAYYSALLTLANSQDLWKKRVAMVSTYYFIKNGSSKECYEIADILINDEHNLIHKAVGWMLREAGKNVSESELKEYLKSYYKTMPRTMLRYAIEKFPKHERDKYLKGQV